MWVARDKNNRLFLFGDKPLLINGECWIGFTKMEIDETLFPNLKWNDEPLEVKLVEVKADEHI